MIFLIRQKKTVVSVKKGKGKIGGVFTEIAKGVVEWSIVGCGSYFLGRENGKVLEVAFLIFVSIISIIFSIRTVTNKGN